MQTNFNSWGNWQLKKHLGTGGFGQVILWKNRCTQLEIATKSLTKSLNLAPDEKKKLKERWTLEFQLMRSLNADFIVRTVELNDKEFVEYLNKQHVWHPLPVLIMEYCNGGDLRAHLQKLENINGLCEYEISEVLRSLSKALDYMHNKHNIKHRDLKPDNIVIHRLENGKKLYKLTDFGFARYINDKTMLQSVVGTRNYFAPEIVDSGGYTKTVDYWSVGVITFEMICGILPFIPHQTLYNLINQLKKKPPNCISITEDFKKPNTFHAHENIFNENHCNPIFKFEIEKWLRLLLNTDHRTRGTALVGIEENPVIKGERILKFYSDLDDILNTRVLSVFFINSNRFYYYNINEAMTRDELLINIVHDLKIDITHLYLILPMGHTLKSVSEIRKAIDLFQEQWCDTSETTNPAAMLFIADVENIELKIIEPTISASIKYCIHDPVPNKILELPIWLIKKFAVDINFLLTNEQRHLVALLRGLHEYALSIEDEAFKFKTELQKILDQSFILKGRIVQFKDTLKAAQQASNGFQNNSSNLFLSWFEEAENFEKKFELFYTKVIINLQKRNDSALRRIKEQVNSPFFEDFIRKDIYGITRFHSHFQRFHQNYRFEELLEKRSVCQNCRTFIIEFLEERANFLQNKQLNSTKRIISDVHAEFRSINKTTKTANEWLIETYKKINESTLNFNIEWSQNLINNSTKSQKEFILHMDGLQMPSTNECESSVIANGPSSSFDELMEIPTSGLIESLQENLRLMSMDLDQP